MTLSPIYEQKLAQVREQGLQQGRRGVIENLLRLKFGFLMLPSRSFLGLLGGLLLDLRLLLRGNVVRLLLVQRARK
jgi:hypothetical protein